MLAGRHLRDHPQSGRPPGTSLGVPNSQEVYTSLSTLVYTSSQGNKFSSPRHLPKRLAEFLFK